MIKEIVFCIIGSMCFAIIMKAPVFCLKYILAGSVITAVTERTLSDFYGNLIACTLAMLTLSIYGELISRQIMVPTTVIVMPATIPLLPGSAVYYSMFYALQGSNELFSFYLNSTIMTGLGIALGSIISSVLIKLINALYHR